MGKQYSATTVGIIASVIFIYLAATAFAAGPFLDPTFGNAGKVVTTFPGGLDTAQGVMIQTDGKIVVAGSSGSDFAMTRSNPDGTLDSTFGTGGRVQTDFPNGNGGLANALLIQPDGKIVLAGSASDPIGGNSVFALVRYNSDGSLDTTFNGNGRVTTTFPGSSAVINAIARQADGKLVVAGSSSDSTTFQSVFALARYNVDGTLDTTFDGDGRVTTDFAGVTFEEAHAVAIQADGKIVAAGLGSSSFAVTRYNTNGSLDNSFDGDGKVTTAFGGSFEEANGIAIQSDQKIVVVGSTALSVASEDNFAIARYNTNGSLDSSFDGDGKIITDFGLVDSAEAVVIQSDQRIVVAGRAGTTAAGSFFAVARYNTNGSLDNSFDTDGKVTTDFSGGRFSLGALAVALQADGKIVAAGDANSSGQRDFGVIRYNSNGALDSTFGGGGKVGIDFALNDETITRVVVQPDGKIIAAGRFNSQIRINGAQDPNFELARYNTDGTLDQTFGVGGVVTTDFGTHGDDFSNAIALQPDGRIIVVGQVGANFSQLPSADTAFGIARYNPNGSPDSSFDGDGLVTTDFGSTHDSAAAVAVQSDGKIVVAGSAGSDFAVARYNSNGTLDVAGFGSSGKLTTDFNNSFDVVRSMVIQPDGKIVVAGSAGDDFALARYNPNGTLDTVGFGIGGKVTTDFFGASDSSADLIIQPDGKLVAAGTASNPNTGSNDFALARYNTNGTLDAGGFGSGGKVTTDLGGYDTIGGLALQGDGGLLVAGLFFPLGGNSRPTAYFALARYSASGNIDSNFGVNGMVTTDFFGIDNQATAVALQSDGRIIVGGFADTGSSKDFALARYALTQSQLLNISTRMPVGTDPNQLIGGFIITGSEPKKVIVLATGPSLEAFGIPGVLADPILELYQGNTLIAGNDNWKVPNGAEIEATGLQPPRDLESALIQTLAPGNYTAIVRGTNGGTGVGTVQLFDLSQASKSKLANISSRGFVQATDDKVMIAGFIIGGNGGSFSRVMVRALGPSLSAFGIPVVLDDPRLELKNANGVTLTSNDDWQQSPDAADISSRGLAPSNLRESALAASLPNGAYSAIVRGKDGGAGVAVVEVYNVE
ncbi:MAG: hypothetical protein QOH88_677 [Verrucomicrobiota bacterium]|jgi:uncharacterized delta-60 repeat protein